MEKIVVVDEKDKVLGSMTKEEANEKGLIRRISRVFIFNQEGKTFLQKRAADILVAPGKWDQSAGGHVSEGENYIEAAKRELKEELGIDLPLTPAFKVYFEEPRPTGEIMKTFNTIFVAKYSGDFKFQKEEVSGGSWVSLSELDEMVKNNPDVVAPGLYFTWLEFRKRYPGSADSILKSLL